MWALFVWDFKCKATYREITSIFHFLPSGVLFNWSESSWTKEFPDKLCRSDLTVLIGCRETEEMLKLQNQRQHIRKKSDLTQKWCVLCYSGVRRLDRAPVKRQMHCCMTSSFAKVTIQEDCASHGVCISHRRVFLVWLFLVWRQLQDVGRSLV